MSLNLRAIVSVFVLIGVMGLIIVATSGTIDYWQAWTYLGVSFVVSLLITIYLIRNDPELLERRMVGGPTREQRKSQRAIMSFTSLAFLGLIVVPALDKRFSWSAVPLPVVLLGDLLVIVGCYFIFRVYRENSYASATIEIAKDQKVIDTGPYSLVRHPMYTSALIYLLGTPLALGSYWGLLPFLMLIPFLIWRLTDEEKMLRTELNGYEEYRHKVRHRLVPGLW
jgi:protein-S-isoprenylcysteine O-methyltransferase Ste14